MATVNLDKKYLAGSQPDGYVDCDIVRSRLFRQTATVDGTTNAGDTFGQSDYIVAAKLPQGFVPEGVVVDVIKANASASTLTVYAAKNATGETYSDGSLTTLGTAALASTGQTFSDLLPSGTVSSSTVSLTSNKWIAGANDLIVLKASADVDAEFIVRVFGRWMAPITEA